MRRKRRSQGPTLLVAALLTTLQPHSLPASPTRALQTANPAVSSFVGSWQATLTGPKARRFILKILPGGQGGLDATMYSIDQNGQPYPATECLATGNELELSIGSLGIRFKGRISAQGDTLAGKWSQNGETRELAFARPTAAAAWEIPSPPARLTPHSINSPGVYEVATVKFADPYANGSGMVVRGRRLEAINSSVNDLIQFAYELNPSQVLGAPEWAGKEKYDAAMLFEGDENPNDPQCKAMVRQILKERFGLQFHRATEQASVYALVLGKNGPKLTKSEGDTNGLPGLYIRAPGMLEVRNATIADLAVTLQRSVLSRPVLDKTGLAGRWDFALEWTPDEEQFTGPPTSAPPRVEGKPDLVTALQNQLGLKMESAKSEVSTFVIEHLEKPTQN